MKVYIAWSVPDYIGIQIEGIFLKEETCKKFVDEHNKDALFYGRWEYDDEDVIED